MQSKSTANVYINGVAADATLKSLRAEAAKLRNELAHLSPTSEEFTKKAERFRAVDDRIQTLNGSLKQTKSLFGQIQTELGKFGTMAVAYLGFEAVTGQIGNLIRKNAEMSDSLADVMKTTGMTEAQVKDLNTAFSQIDTRTGRKELLELARDAGKLGITGKKEVEEFVRAADKINVALGEDLGKDAITQIGKLVSLFRLKEQFGLEQSMLKVASAMNTLGASSEASEGYITDFLSRMGGIAPMANISIDQVMALGATLDSLGQTSEVSSTALSKMFTKMASDAATYARIAGVSTAEFRQTMNDNALGALMMVLEAAGKTEGGLIQLTETLGDLGVEGGRATGVFGVLAKNTDLLKKQMDIAKQSFQDGSSVLDEFNTKNTNLAANVEKLQKFFGGLFTNGMLSRGIKNMVSYFASFIEPGETAIETTRKLTNEINGQLYVLRNANFTAEQRKKLIDKINSAYGEYLPRLITEKDTTADIVELQQQFNSNMTTKINMMRYEEELTLILKRQHAAAELLYNVREKIGGLGKEDLEPSVFANTLRQLKTQEALAQSVMDNTDAQIEALKKKFQNIQDLINGGQTAPVNNSGAASTGNTGSFKSREDELKKLYELDLLMLKKSLADKTITKEQYDERATALELKHMNDRITAAKLYKEDTVKLELEMYDLLIKINEQGQGELMEQAKAVFVAEEALLVDQLNKGIITKEQYELRSQELKTQSLEAQKALMVQYGANVDAIEKQITESKAKEAKLRIGITSDELDKQYNEKRAALELDLLNTNPDSNAELKAKLAMLDQEKAMVLANKELTEIERLAIEKRYDEQALALKRGHYTKVQDVATGAFMQIMGAVYTMNMNRLNSELQANSKAHKNELDFLKSRLDKQLISEEEYNAQVERVNKEYAERERETKQEMFRREKRARIIEATINTLTSVTRVLYNPVLAAIVGIAGAAQVAAIASQPVPEFAKGGFTGSGAGQPDKTGYKIAGVVHENEYVVPQWMLRQPVYANVVDWLESQRMGQGGYADGGFVGGVKKVIKNSVPARIAGKIFGTNNDIDEQAPGALPQESGMAEGMQIMLQMVEYLDKISSGVENGFVIGDDEIFKMSERLDKIKAAQERSRIK